MEETGVILRRQGVMATVLVQKKGACEGCAAAGTCKPSDETAELEALNPINAVVGQTVKVVLKPQLYLKTSFIVYGLPATALVGGAILGKELGIHYFQGIDSDIIAAAVGFGAMMFTLLIIRLWSKTVEKNKEYVPVIEEVIQPGIKG